MHVRGHAADNTELAANLLDSDGRSVGTANLAARRATRGLLGSSIWAVSHRVSEKGDFALRVCLQVGGKDIQGSPFKVEVRKEENMIMIMIDLLYLKLFRLLHSADVRIALGDVTHPAVGVVALLVLEDLQEAHLQAGDVV